MSQTSIIAGGLLLAYFIFITVRGELPCYLQVLGVSTDAQCPQGNVTAGNQICSGSSTVSTSNSTGSTGSSGTGGTGSGIGSGGLGGIGTGSTIGSGGCIYGVCSDGSCADDSGLCEGD
jgi:hypothetical protein